MKRVYLRISSAVKRQQIGKMSLNVPLNVPLNNSTSYYPNPLKGGAQTLNKIYVSSKAASMERLGS